MADTARFAQKQVRRPQRIVPAIPHRLAKPQPSARPITPEESNKGTVTQPSKPQPQPQPEPQVVVEEADEQTEAQQAGAVETPLTPDSRTSGAGKSEAEAPVLASSPATSQDDNIALANTQVTEHQVNGHAHKAFAPPAATPADLAEDKPAVNGVHRKLTIPAHLPPAFVPSLKPDTQTPPADASDTTHTPLHRHQLSAGALVFQSAAEPPSLPLTPQEEAPSTHGQQHLPRPPPGFGPPQFAPFVPGHSQHPSEAGAPWQLPPHAVAPPDPAYDNGAEHTSTHVQGPTVYSNLYSGQFSAGETTSVGDGGLTSHSQSPSKAQFSEGLPTSDHGDEPPAIMYQNGATPTERLEESAFELAAFLSTQLGNPEFADFLLQIRSTESILLSMPVHGIVVVRSLVIAEAIRRSPGLGHRSRDARRLVDVLALDPLATRESLQEAVNVLYGGPLLSAQNFLYGLGPYPLENDQGPPSNEARRRMGQVLSYIAAARTFQMPSMQARGIEIARLLMRWDTVDQVLRYALQATPTPRSRVDSPDTDDPFLATLLNYALEFLAYYFPVDFTLYTIAPEFQDAPRLPTLVESRQPTHNPRLSKIRFGDAPPEDHLQPSHATSVLSTILLSLPLSIIERLFNHRMTANRIGWTGAAKVLRDVIDEREGRRQKALRGQLKPTSDGTIPPALLDSLYIEEHVEHVEPSPLYPSGHRLTTKRVANNV